jgi:hypothetical protein
MAMGNSSGPVVTGRPERRNMDHKLATHGNQALCEALLQKSKKLSARTDLETVAGQRPGLEDRQSESSSGSQIPSLLENQDCSKCTWKDHGEN